MARAEVSVGVPLAPAPIKSQSLMAKGGIVSGDVGGVARYIYLCARYELSACTFTNIYLLKVSISRFSTPYNTKNR